MEIILRRESESKGIKLGSYFDRYFSLEKEFNKIYNCNAKGLKEMCQVLGFTVSTISGMEACKIMSNVVAFILRDNEKAFKNPISIDFQNVIFFFSFDQINFVEKDPWENIRNSIVDQLEKQSNEENENGEDQSNEEVQDEEDNSLDSPIVGRPRKSTLESDGKNSASGNKKENILPNNSNIESECNTTNENRNDSLSNCIESNKNNQILKNSKNHHTVKQIPSQGEGEEMAKGRKNDPHPIKIETKFDNQTAQKKKNKKNDIPPNLGENENSNNHNLNNRNKNKTPLQNQTRSSSPSPSPLQRNNIPPPKPKNAPHPIKQINNIQNLQPKKNPQKKEPTRAIKLR